MDNKFPGTKRVTIIFEDYRYGGYHEIEQITSDDFDFIFEEVKGSNDLKINFLIHRGDIDDTFMKGVLNKPCEM